ncbi:MAG: AAA family ATPase [Caldithrix sp.]|nr:AAA family ATPase [Caldithrix sp.]
MITREDLNTAIHILKPLDHPLSQDTDTSMILDDEMRLLESNEGPIRAKSTGQKDLINKLQNNDIVFAIGPAGTGKTYLAVAMAVSYLKSQQIRKIILARPAVEAGESLGFLPGDFKEKIEPYLKPLYDALEDMLPKELIKKYLDLEVIEILPLAYMRGRTLNNAFVILDEAQNSTFTQMKMFLTRLGFNSKAVITGDVTQIDLPKNNESGLISSIKVLKNISGIAFVKLGRDDVVRHQLVKNIIDAYDKYGGNA